MLYDVEHHTGLRIAGELALQHGIEVDGAHVVVGGDSKGGKDRGSAFVVGGVRDGQRQDRGHVADMVVILCLRFLKLRIRRDPEIVLHIAYDFEGTQNNGVEIQLSLGENVQARVVICAEIRVRQRHHRVDLFQRGLDPIRVYVPFVGVFLRDSAMEQIEGERPVGGHGIAVLRVAEQIDAKLQPAVAVQVV